MKKKNGVDAMEIRLLQRLAALLKSKYDGSDLTVELDEEITQTEQHLEIFLAGRKRGTTKS